MVEDGEQFIATLERALEHRRNDADGLRPLEERHADIGADTHLAQHEIFREEIRDLVIEHTGPCIHDLTAGRAGCVECIIRDDFAARGGVDRPQTFAL